MNTRRHFLKAVAGAGSGIVFCGCGWPSAAQAQPAGPARRPVSVNGKRVRTVDVHAHCFFREATSLLGEEASRPTARPVRGVENIYIAPEQRIAAMDAQAIDMEVLSINPFWYGRERDLAARIVGVQNEKLAEFVAAHSDRFAAFASLTLQD